MSNRVHEDLKSPRSEKDPVDASTAQPSSGSGSAGRRRSLPPCTDVGNAELFAALLRDRWRYDCRRGIWLMWDEHRWSEDKDGRLYRDAKRVVRYRPVLAARLEADAEVLERERRFARKSESQARLDAMLKLARNEKPLADSGEHWDEDPLLLGVANGVVDLRTGQLRPGCRSDRITKHTKVRFDPAARAPKWEEFLREIFKGDEELISYIQRAVGYSLTGETSEQCFFVCFGTGSNGKSTFLEVIRYVAGDYGYNMPFATIELASRNSVPNDLAALEGRRLITCSEANESARLNEARMKALTGEDEVTARYLYREFFSFRPVGKVWLAVNHLPIVTDDSPGFWRRVRVIPFRATFEADARNKRLIKELKAEAPGILAWAVRGCLEWRQHGLGTARAIALETEAYRKDMDIVGQFIEDQCVVRQDAQVPAGELREAYESWSRANGLQPVSWQVFARRLKMKGFEKKRVGHRRTRTWAGLCLKEGTTGEDELATDALAA